MVRCARRLRRWGSALAGAMLAAAIAACGGGGGGGGSTSTPPPTGGNTAPESAHLLAEFVAQDSNHQVVRVWDPAHPDVAIESVPLAFTNGIIWTSSHLVFSDATQYDATTHRITTLGHARVFYDNDGHLFTIDLRGGQSHAPVQLSSAVDVFTQVNVFPVSSDGADAWVDVQGGSHDWAIRSTMTATDAPIAVLAISGAMRDPATGLPQYFLTAHGSHSGTAQTPTTFQVVDAAFNAVTQATVATMGNLDAWLGADPAQPGLGYLKVGGTIRAIHWSAGGVTVDAASLHDFAYLLGSVPGVADANALYLTDGTSLLAASNGAVRAVAQLSAVPDQIVDAGAYVAAGEASSASPLATNTQVESVNKASGVVAMIESQGNGVQLLGGTDAGIILSGTPEGGQAFLLASGDNLVRRTAGSQSVGLVRSASHLPDQPGAPVALLSCTAGSETGFCAAGNLQRLDIATPANAFTLGALAASAAWVHQDLVDGLASSLEGVTFLESPGGFGTGEVSASDAWQLTPGTAGSLVRVTTNLP